MIGAGKFIGHEPRKAYKVRDNNQRLSVIRIWDFGKTFVLSTGRISSEMALKCSVAGIPVIASRGATTSLALEIAERTRLTVIGFVRASRMNIYTCCWRVTGELSDPAV